MDKWISIKEKIPEKDGRYLVTEAYNWPWVGVCSLRNGKWDSSTVSHWMELPEAANE
jgi:hypothetical protein